MKGVAGESGNRRTLVCRPIPERERERGDGGREGWMDGGKEWRENEREMKEEQAGVQMM